MRLPLDGGLHREGAGERCVDSRTSHRIGPRRDDYRRVIPARRRCRKRYSDRYLEKRAFLLPT